jgi:hypothetical protein
MRDAAQQRPFPLVASGDPPDAGQVLFEADRTKKGEGPERLQIAVKDYLGKKYLDLRIWWRNRDGAWLPSKKGITIREREIDDVLCVLGEAKRLFEGRP